MTKPKIEPARPADLPAIRTLIRALSAFHDDDAPVTLAWLQDAFFGPADRATAFVARDGDTIIGYAGVMHKIVLHAGTERFDIQHLYVADGHRSQGIGRALIAATRDFAASRGATGLTIGTSPRNLTAHASYRAMKLEEVTDSGPRFWIPSQAP